MSLPVIAIIGRPNVGKSSLLNSFAGERISIVDSTPGVTRDRVSALVPYRDVVMEMVDTGGIGVVDQDDLSEHIERQIAFALEGANLILFVVDVRDGITPLDRLVAARLRERSIIPTWSRECMSFTDWVLAIPTASAPMKAGAVRIFFRKFQRRSGRPPGSRRTR